MKEDWKDVKGYEGLYQVSSMGNVKSLRRKRFIHQHDTSNGYMQVHLWKGGKAEYLYVHRLVANAFINRKCAEDLHVNHKDENRKNNSSANLEWCTNKYNHAYGNYRAKQFEAKRLNGKNKYVFQFSKDGNLLMKYRSMHHAERITGVLRKDIKAASDSGTLKKDYYWTLSK